MAVRKRGERWVVERYDSVTKKKRYIGTYPTFEFACMVETAVRAGLPMPKQDPLSGFRIGSTESVVYFVAAPDLGFVKIGWTTDLPRRLADLQVACPVELRVLHLERGPRREREGELHRQFRLYRVRGEWFRIAGALAEFLDGVIDADPVLRLVSEESA